MSQARPPTPAPPDPFAPGTTVIEAGATLYGVYTNLFRPTECKPRFGEGGRFHFFGDPPVPVLHLADSREAALAERLLRNIPVEHPEPLRRSAYRNEVLAGLAPARPLRPAQFFGLGLRQLGIDEPAHRHPGDPLRSDPRVGRGRPPARTGRHRVDVQARQPCPGVHALRGPGRRTGPASTPGTWAGVLQRCRLRLAGGHLRPAGHRGDAALRLPRVRSVVVPHTWGS